MTEVNDSTNQLPLEQLRQVRIDKVKKLKELGVNSFPQPKIDRQNISDVRNLDLDKACCVVGRVLAKRGHGKLMFFDIKDFTGRMQIVVKADTANEISIKVAELLDIGDFIKINGKTYKTNAGEFSVLASELQLLTKSLRPLPNKTEGFVDKEEKYRQRYADMILDDKTFGTLVERSKIVQIFRTFFLNHGFFEVNTPTLQEVYGGASARPFVTHHNALDADFYLRISPELFLKRLIVGGFEKVFEFTINFRNEGIGRWHNPEFQNIEFYWAYSTYEELMDFTEEMFRYAVKTLKGSYELKYGEDIVNFENKFERLTFRDALLKYTEIDIDVYTNEEDLRKLISEKKLLNGKDLATVGYANLLDVLYKRTTRPNLRGPLFLTDYPAEMIALAKKKENDATKISTFQLLILGEEFVKAYNELNDPIDQQERWEETERTALAGQDEAEKLDTDFVRALEYGMPPTAGWGLGFERTIALLTDNHSVKDVMFFPTLRPEHKNNSGASNGSKNKLADYNLSINKSLALDMLHANMQNQNLRRHCYGVATALGGIYDYLKESNKFNGDSPDSKEAWEVFGILHDSDYELTKDDWTKHTLITLEWLIEHGIDKTDPLYLGMMSHNNKITKLREPETQMEWALECADELSGFIVAVSLVKGGKISDVDVSSVQKKWKQKAFAAAVDRSQTEQVQEKLGIELEKFMEVVLNAMKANKEELGLS